MTAFDVGLDLCHLWALPRLGPSGALMRAGYHSLRPEDIGLWFGDLPSLSICNILDIF
jgi:hypothetical protein